MEKTDDKVVFYDRICKFCKNNLICDHDKFTEERFYNGIATKRCLEYKFNDEVE